MKKIRSNTIYYYSPILFLLFSLILIRPLHSQKSERVTNQKVNQVSKEVSPDFKILNSSAGGIELEFVPDYSDNFDFENSVSDINKYGSPDVKFRSFPVFFPDNKSYRVEVVDARYEEVAGQIKPVPAFKNSKNKEGLVPVFVEDEKIYRENKYYPAEAAFVGRVGALRNKYFGNLKIYPCQYNPATGTVRKYNYLRVRIVFGGTLVVVNKPLSFEERSFIRNAAINSEIAENWSTREFNHEGDSGPANSVLASGDFYKIEVRETGMYKLDRNFLQSAGINVGSIDPRTIKIYGNGGEELSYDNLMNVPTDPVENCIYVSGEDDGQFNNGDFIVFYGKSANDWKYDASSRNYYHKINHYSAANYYWITYGGNNGLRMSVSNSPAVQGLQPLTEFNERFFDEPEVNNLASTGLLWLSQRISVNQSFTFNKELKGYVDGSNVNFRFRFGNGSFFPNTWRLEDVNSNFLMNQFVPQLTNGFSHISLVHLNNNLMGVNYPLLPGKTGINFKASLRSQDGNSPNVAGYYDYYEVHYKRKFLADNNVLRFNSPDTSGVLEFQVNGFSASDIKIYNVTDFRNVGIVNPISFSNGTARFQSNTNPGEPNEFFAVGGSSYKTPASVSSRIPNQNLKGDLINGASFIIITPKDFANAAERLKAHREIPGDNYIRTTVVDIEKIYNEFGAGLSDPMAIRNFLKFANTYWQERPVYVLFFGDGSYDYKNIYNLSTKNWIFPVEKNSEYANDVDSYCSDDYLVELNESYPEPGGITIPDLGHGRLPVNSSEEANVAVDKILAYENPATFDKWRTECLYIADDGWTTENVNGEEGSLHTDQCEDVAQNYSPGYLKKNKIYIVSYPSEFTPQGRRKPSANTDIIREWNEGKLIINYTGHGSIDLWAHEHIFERQVTIPLLTNKDKYSFVTIASCDLARWDDPYNLSAGEQLVIIKDKGAIGVLAAVRPVYSIPNATFNNKFYQNMFTIDTLNMTLRLGKAMFNVKQSLFFENDLKFALMSDPTIRLGVPQVRTRIDSINSTSGNTVFEMKALQKVKISGSIIRPDSTVWSDYNGTFNLEVLDVDKIINYVDFGYAFNYRLFGGTIYVGRTNISNGKWTVDFVVPRDISYNPGRGKILSYFNNQSTDGLGYSDNFTMNGIDSTAQIDTLGPVVNIYLDSRNFRTGDLVNQNPKLIADFTDENGINLTGTIGHKIEAVVNDDENNKIDLTPYYTSNNSYQNGSVEYQMDNLADGHYKLNVKAWDTYNNFSSSSVEFDVKSNSELVLEDIYNYPNPMQDFTNFVFEHNLDDPLIADIRIYTIGGRLIRELNKSNITDKFVSIEWDGKDSDGDIIANGTYIYKILIKSEDGSFSKSSIGKLAKLK